MSQHIYQRLNTALKDMLTTGEFVEGAKFLTERQVAERFGVSRITANKALANLVSENRLEFRKGVGTFVRKGTLDYNLRNLTSFTSMAQSLGRKPETVVLKLEVIPDGVPELGEAPVYFVERLRLADGVPVILERRHFLLEPCPDLTKEDLEGSIARLWREKYSLHITGVEQTIRALNVDGIDAGLLQMQPKAAGLLCTSIGFVDSPQRFWVERSLYRGDAYEFFNRMGCVESPDSSVGRLISPTHPNHSSDH